MSKTQKIAWVEPRIVNMEQLPTTLGACADGGTAGSAGGAPGQLKCANGGIPSKNQCNAGQSEAKL
jgi:hypothetical protein